MLTLSYIGAVRSMPNYNVMGVAKASLEANIRYMASSLGPERDFLHHVEEASPLRRNVTIDEVGNAAAFLCSDLASAITGEITYVDCGYNSIGMS